MDTLSILFIGFVFGLLVAYPNLNKFNVMAGLALGRDFTAAKTLLLTVGLGIILFLVGIYTNYVGFHIVAVTRYGTLLGGFIFGIGVAVLGYTPGTLVISMGQGAIDAFIGIIGGLVGGILYSWAYPHLQGVIGVNYGSISLLSIMNYQFSSWYILIALIIAFLLFAWAFALNRRDSKIKIANSKWIYSAFGLAILLLFLLNNQWYNRILSTWEAYPFVGDAIINHRMNTFYSLIAYNGAWQMLFLFGAFIAGFVIAIFRKEFRFHLTSSLWEEFKGPHKGKRIVWAFIGGIFLIFGACMAWGGICQHLISGGVQLAVSAYIFVLFACLGFFLTGYAFYRHGL